MSITIKKFGIYLADLNPRMGTEPSKFRPVVVIQTDLLNNLHPSTIVCPMTSKVNRKLDALRVHIPKKFSKLPKDSDVLVDQIRAIDNRRITKYVGSLSLSSANKLLDCLNILIFQ